MSESLVILLHGVGSSGADIGGLEPVLAPGLPNTRFAAPDAPGRFNIGHQWFSIIGVTEENRPDRVLAARPAFDSLIAETISRAGFNARLDRVAFVGFSQGSIMALDAFASGRWPVAGIVAFSGRLASPKPLTPNSQTRLLLVHGSDDAMMPASETEEAAQILGNAGVDVSTLILPGLGHSISGEGVVAAQRFLADVLD